MPRLPDVTSLGERPTPQPGGGVVSYRPTSGAETAPGEAVFKAGDTLRQTGGAMETEYARQEAESRRKAAEEKAIKREAEIEQERIDKTHVENAVNSLRSTALDLTMGEQNGFVNRRGSDALSADFLGRYRGAYQTAAKTMQAGLANDRQRELFGKFSAIVGQQFETDLLRHRLQEDDRFKAQVYDGTLATETMQATSRWQDPAAVAFSLARIDEAIKTEAERRGWGPEVAEAQRLAQHAKVHAGVIGQAIAVDNFEFARQWFERYRGEIDPGTAKVVQNAITDSQQKSLFAGYQRSFLESRNSRGHLAAIEKAVEADPTLDEQRKNILLARIGGRMETIDRQAALAQERRAREIEHTLDRVNTLTMQGYEPSVEQLAPLLSAAKGTELEPRVRQMVSTAAFMSRFRLAEPREQEALINQAEAEARKDPNRFDVRLVQAMKSVQTAQQTAIKNDPISWGVRQGLLPATDPAAQPLDLSKPSAIGPQLKARAQFSRALVARYQAPNKMITQEEADQVSNALRSASAPIQAAWLADLSRAFEGDSRAYMSVMDQIAPGNPSVAIAGARAAMQTRDGASLAVSDLILRGKEIRKQKQIALPEEGDFEKLFSGEVGRAFASRPEARKALLQAAVDVYAAQASDRGESSKILDHRRWSDAIEAVVGKVERYQGKEVVLPHGMDYSAFRTALTDRLDDLVASGRLDPMMTRERLRSLPAENRGDGKYVLGAGDSVLVDKAGQLVVIDVAAPSPSAAARPTRAGAQIYGYTGGDAVAGMARPKARGPTE